MTDMLVLSPDPLDVRVPMSHLRLSRDVESVPSALVELLTDRPPSWLRSFLRLATLHVPAAPVSARPVWFRVGAPTVDAHGATVMTFVWHPHAGNRVFERFHGRIVAGLAGTGGTSLTIEGDATGGEPADDVVVLSSLLDLLAAAVAAQVPEG